MLNPFTHSMVNINTNYNIGLSSPQIITVGVLSLYNLIYYTTQKHEMK